MGGRVSSPQFVGRAEQLGLLGAAFDLAKGGRTTTVLVGGEAGGGKTRLVEEFSKRARQEGALVATGVCVPTDAGGLPYAPVVGIVRDAHLQLGQLDEPVQPGDDFAKTRLFESVLAFVTTLAHTSSIVLVFEDLHWADSASAELLGYLVRNLTDARALIVATYRSEELMRDHPLHGWLTELSRHPRTSQLRLPGLDRAETASLIGGILGQQPNWALVDAVWARSQGNPFFAEELTAARDDPSLSPELQGVILSRVESLSKDAQQVLRVVAAAGPTITHQLVAALGVLDADALDRALAEAVDKQIVVVDLAGSGYRFRHALLREAVYAAILPGERVRLHRLLATTLAAQPALGAPGPGHRVAELAGHWWAAGEWPLALEASTAAAEATAAIGAFREALAHAEHALSALDHVTATTGTIERHQLLARASEIAYLATAGQRAVELAQAAIDCASPDLDAVTASRYYILLGRHEWGRGHSQAAVDAYRHAVALLPTDPPTVELARVLAEEARWLMLVARHREAEARCHEALAVARAVDARAVEGHAMNTLGCCRSGLGYADEGIDLLRQAIVIATEVGSAEDLDRGYINLGNALVEWGHYEEAATLIRESLAAGERIGFPRLNGVSDNSASALVALGRYDEAEVLMAETGPRGVGICGVAPQVGPAEIALLRGQLDDAARLLAEADEASAQLSDVQTRGWYHMLAATLELERGHAADAYAHVELALVTTEGTEETMYAPSMCALGVRALADGRAEARDRGRQNAIDDASDAAVALVEKAQRIVDSCYAAGGRPAPRAVRAVAMCVAEQSRLTQSDPSLWAYAVQLRDASGEPYEAAYCRWRQAEALLENRAGRREATECLQLAFATASRIGANPLRTHIEQLAQRARITLSVSLDVVPSSAASLGLTPRELEILGQLADGLTDGEIAAALFISKKTASVHVSNVLRKLDVGNRVEAGRVGQAHGLGALGTPTHAVVSG